MRINKLKFLRGLIFIVCLLIGLYIGLMFIIKGLSWFGLYIGFMSWGIVLSILEAIEEEKAPSTRTTQRQKRYAKA